MAKFGVKPVTVSLLLAVVVVCLTVLSVLTLSTAAADERLARRYAESVRADYALEEEAQKWLADFDADLKSGLIEEPRVEKTVGVGEERHISIVLEVDVEKRTYQVLEWKKQAPEPAGLENLFTGA